MGRWLIVGGTGLLGRALIEQLDGADVVATHHRSAPPEGRTAAWRPLDVRSRGAIDALVAEVGPDIVVNAAYVQAGPDVESVTAVAPRRLSAACAAGQARFVQVSTDLVFAGTLDRPYREDDAPTPITSYGEAKVRAERACGGDDLIVRTSLLYAGTDPGPQERLVAAAASDPDLRFFVDEIRNPIRVDELASAIVSLAPESSGLVHLAGPDAVDRLTFARSLAPGLGVDPDQLIGGVADPARGPRPKRCALDSSLGYRLLGWRPTGVG